jgi:hypothetical protein
MLGSGHTWAIHDDGSEGVRLSHGSCPVKIKSAT